MRRAQLARWLGEDDAARARAVSRCRRARDLAPLAALEDAARCSIPAQADLRAAHRGRADRGGPRRAIAREPGWMLDLSYGFSGEDMSGMEPRSDMLSAMVTVDLPLFRGEPPGPRGDRRRARGGARPAGDARRSPARDARDAGGGLGHRATVRPSSSSSTRPTWCRWRISRFRRRCSRWRSNRAMVDEVVAARRVALETRMKHLRLVGRPGAAQYDIDYLVGEAAMKCSGVG